MLQKTVYKVCNTFSKALFGHIQALTVVNPHKSDRILQEAVNYQFTLHELAIREQNRGRFMIGNPAQVKAQIEQLKQSASIDEIMVADFYADQQTRIKGHTLFAQMIQEL